MTSELHFESLTAACFKTNPTLSQVFATGIGIKWSQHLILNWQCSQVWIIPDEIGLLTLLRLTIGVLTIRISVRLSDRSKVTQNKINFVKNCPQWGLNPWPSDHHFDALPTGLGSCVLGRRFLKWALCHALLNIVELCLFLESIEHDFTKALMIQTDNQIVT